MLKGKTVVIAVSGSIAAYKMPNVARMLKKLGADVQVLMTQNATQFINPITFESLTGNKCLIDTFDRNFQYSVEHVALAKRADVVLIAPASANVIGKLANGLADDMLTTTVIACPCKKIVAPAMNHNMYHNPIVQDNIEKLKRFGYEIVTPASGMLANGDLGDGRMPDEEILFQHVLAEIAFEKDLAGKKVLVTAGATREPIDPVRFITNHSSGKMGCAIAKQAVSRGASVTLVLARHSVEVPQGVNVINVQTTQEMHDRVMEQFDVTDAFIMAAAPCDYRPESFSNSKIKTDSLTLNFVKNVDIAQAVGAKKGKKVLVAFSAETDNEIANATNKRIKKNADFIVCNNVKSNDVFASATNVVSIIDKDGVTSYDKMSKDAVAALILDKLSQVL